MDKYTDKSKGTYAGADTNKDFDKTSGGVNKDFNKGTDKDFNKTGTKGNDSSMKDRDKGKL